MTHRFNAEVAEKCGLVEAILIENLFYWTEKGKQKPIFHEDRNWAYCSVKKFRQLMPYLSERQIRYAIEGMTKKGILHAKHIPQAPDNTLCYSLSDDLLKHYQSDKIKTKTEAEAPSVETPDFIRSTEESVTTNCTNRFIQNVQTESEAVDTKCINPFIQNVQTGLYKKDKPYTNSKNNDKIDNKIDSTVSHTGTGKLFEIPTTTPPKNNFKKWSFDEFCVEVNKCQQYGAEMREAFIRYWSEQNAAGKMKFQLQETWSTSGRLVTWASKEFNQPKNKANGTQQQSSPNRAGHEPATNQNRGKSAGASSLLDSLRNNFLNAS